jgi:hypothetical protein
LAPAGGPCKRLDLSVQEIAVEEGVTPSCVTRILRLTFLAPDILVSILSGLIHEMTWHGAAC